MTIASGMRPRRLRIPTALADGGTGARTAPESRSALGVPGLTDDNYWTGMNTFDGRFLVATVQAISDLTLLTTDTVTLTGGTGSAVFDLTALTGSRILTAPNASGTLALTGDPVKAPYVAKSGVYGASTSDCVINCTGTWTLTLPTAVGVSGRFYFIKNSGAGVITVACTGGQTIDGAATQAVATTACLQVCSDGANWIIT